MKSSIVLILILAIFNAAYAISSYGIKGGINLSDLIGVSYFDEGDSGNPIESIFTFSAGMFINFELNDHTDFVNELLITRKGADYSGYNAQIRMDYIEAIYLLQFKIIPENEFKPFISA